MKILIVVIKNWMLILWSVIASFHSWGGNVLFLFVEFFEGGEEWLGCLLVPRLAMYVFFFFLVFLSKHSCILGF